MELNERSLNFIAESTDITGDLRVEGTVRVHGKISGSILGGKGSEIIICESGHVAGEIRGARVVVNGYVEGQIVASDILILSAHGRVRGSMQATSIKIAPGAFFEGEALTEKKTRNQTPKDPESTSEHRSLPNP